ncbi:Leucine-rich repeat-containing protein 71 [Boothiomyces sp. JEL0866]|nr:Leucine-rich repeat-containing protein 71 [Boothiomyces sp. JEL0866]KAJ3320958.1 Leucine-rich repeat-containing protein 71 [Boothiomyces sp. JEL0866]
MDTLPPEVGMAQELIGNFEQDYPEVCKRLGTKPLHVLKFGSVLPPLPLKPSDILSPELSTKSSEMSMPQSRIGSAGRKHQVVINDVEGEVKSVIHTGSKADLLADGAISTHNISHNGTAKTYIPSRKVVSDRREISIQEFLKKGQIEFGSGMNFFSGLQWTKRQVPYTSRYKFTPTVNILMLDGEEDEEVLYKIEIRGWKIPIQNLEALNLMIPQMHNLVNVSLWNCGLTNLHLPSILSICVSGNIRQLLLDQNPLIPEISYGSFLGEDSCLRTLTLRGNHITDLGAKLISNALKTNRNLVGLDLFENKIQKAGAEALSDALKVNSCLQALNLGKNNIGDDGALYLSKALSNYPLSPEEVQQRKKQISEIDRQKHDIEEDPGANKNKKGRRAPSAMNKPADKGDKKGAAKAGTAAPVAKKGTEPTPPAGKKVEDPKAKKAAPPVEDKKAKKPVSVQKNKKGKPEDLKEEAEETVDVVNNFEPMFEVNNQWYILGNRTLNSLNLCSNGITDHGLKILYELVNEQEITSEQALDGMLGLFRLILIHNNISYDNPMYVQLNTLLNSRNPFFEPVDDMDISVDGNNEGGEFGEGDNDEVFAEEQN